MSGCTKDEVVSKRWVKNGLDAEEKDKMEHDEGNEAEDEKMEEMKRQLSRVTNLEDVLELVGTRGRWNYLVFFISSISVCFIALITLNYQFLGATPDHWCHVAPLREANWTTDQILSLAASSQIQKTEGCRMNDYNYTAAAQLGYEGSLARPDLLSWHTSDDPHSTDIPCLIHEFNLTQYSSSIVTQWDLVCERRVLYSTTQAANQLGFLVGSIIAGVLMDFLGRRYTAILSVVANLVLGLATALSTTAEIFITLRFANSVCLMTLYYSAFLTVMETGSPKSRSFFGGLFVIPWSLGVIVLPGIAYFVRQWNLLQVVLTLPFTFLLVYFWLLPESPRWLLLKGRQDEALKVLLWACRVNRRPVPPTPALRAALQRIRTRMTKMEDKEVESLEESKRDLGVTGRWRTITRGFMDLVSTRQLAKCLLVMSISWFTASMVYYGLSLNATNLSADPYLYMFLSGVTEVPAYIVLLLCLQYLGRRSTLITLYLIGATCIFLNAVLMFAIPHVHVAAKIVLSLVGKMAVADAFHLLYVYTAELFPTRNRSLAMGICGFVGRTGSIISPYVNDLLGAAEPWAPSALFSCTALLSGTLTFMLPETKDRILPDDAQHSLNASSDDIPPSATSLETMVVPVNSGGANDDEKV